MPTIAGEVAVTRHRIPCGTLLRFVWTADASGDAKYNLDRPLQGELWKAETKPLSVAAAYDITLEDEHGFDALHDACANRSASATEMAFIAEETSPTINVNATLNGLYSFVVNAGNADEGITEIWIKHDANQATNPMPTPRVC